MPYVAICSGRTSRRRPSSRCSTHALASGYVGDWFAPRAAAELLHFRSLVDQVGSADVLRVVLARAARSARRTTHFDLDFPREPQLEPYWCYKHRRDVQAGRGGTPVPAALHARHARPDRSLRCRAGARASTPRLSTATRATSTLAGPFDGDRHVASVSGADRLPRAASVRLRAARPRATARGRARETGARRRSGGDPRVRRGNRRRAREREGRPRAGRAGVHRRQRPARPLPGDPRPRRTSVLEDRLERHVNRRTGRRAGEYFESVLVCRAV